MVGAARGGFLEKVEVEMGLHSVIIIIMIMSWFEFCPEADLKTRVQGNAVYLGGTGNTNGRVRMRERDKKTANKGYGDKPASPLHNWSFIPLGTLGSPVEHEPGVIPLECKRAGVCTLLAEGCWRGEVLFPCTSVMLQALSQQAPASRKATGMLQGTQMVLDGGTQVEGARMAWLPRPPCIVSPYGPGTELMLYLHFPCHPGST